MGRISVRSWAPTVCGMMVELAIGDAYGGGFEYAPAAFVAEHNTVEGYLQHPTHAGIEPGRYTDDTQMSLAVAELLADGAEWTPLNLADKFVEVYRRDPRAGYAGGFQVFLRTVTSGREFLDRIRPGSDKSGAAMRVGPVGLLPTVAEVRHHAAVQARVTHDTPSGVASAEAAALAVHYCHHRAGPLEAIGRWISEQLSEDWARPWQGKVGAKGAMSVRAAITALANATTMRGLLRECVAYTGDVDTVATIAMAAAARSPEVVDDLPEALYRDLENGTYGRDHLAGLDRRLGI
jgi:ADP-ribosyl-[dinitrogen reductase] hydrolase